MNSRRMLLLRGWNSFLRSRVGVGMNMSARERVKRFQRSNRLAALLYKDIPFFSTTWSFWIMYSRSYRS